ncbi:hypothetical protein D3C80_1739010 [compost metagenome]
MERRIDVQVDADKADHLLVAIADGDGARLHQGTGPAAGEVTLGVILPRALDVFQHPQGQIGDRRPQGSACVEAVRYLDNRLVQILQGVQHHFAVLAEQFGQTLDEALIRA